MGEGRVGLVGLGVMGNPMARRILNAGWELTAFDIRDDALADVVEAGATGAESPRELASQCDFILTSLPSLSACEAVYYGDDGLLAGAREGTVLVETSTVTPSTVRGYQEAANGRGISFVDSPLLARNTYHPELAKLKSSEMVEAGKVAVFVGGDDEDVARVLPILSSFGDPVTHVGPLGSGVMVKVLSNAASHAYFVVALEVLAVAAKAGIDLKKAIDIFEHTNARGVAMNVTIPYYLEHGAGMSMNIEAGIKDSEAMIEVARDVDVPVLMQEINLDYYRQAMEKFGAPSAPWDAELIKLFESLTDSRLEY